VTEKDLYIAICQQQPAAIPLFARCWWLDAVCEPGEKWNVALAMKGDQVRGFWPYVHGEKLSISMMRNARLTPYMGPHTVFPDDLSKHRRDSFEYEVCSTLLDQIPDSDVWRLSLQPGIKQAGLFRRAGLKVEVQQTFLCSLEESEEEIFYHFREPLRRNLRSAEGKIRIAEEPEALEQLYTFQKSTLDEKRVVQSYSLEQMKRLLDACLHHGSGTLLSARSEEGLEAVCWIVWDEERAYYFMGAKNPGTESYRAMSSLLWHAIRQAKARGNKYFDFEGSMDGGVERFFRGFGAERELYLVLHRDGHWFWRLLRTLRFR
jgi:hypothetical protein